MFFLCSTNTTLKSIFRKVHFGVARLQVQCRHGLSKQNQYSDWLSMGQVWQTNRSTSAEGATKNHRVAQKSTEVEPGSRKEERQKEKGKGKYLKGATLMGQHFHGLLRSFFFISFPDIFQPSV